MAPTGEKHSFLVIHLQHNSFPKAQLFKVFIVAGLLKHKYPKI